MEIVKTDREYVNLVLSSIRSDNPLSRMSKTNRESLKEIVKYLSKLNRQNLIDEKQLTELISLACANYIENEVELRIEKTINNKLLYFFEKI
jgi:hypothetical protein